MADGITRGTTPSITVTVPMDLTGYTCYLSIGRKPKAPYFTADNSQMVAEYGETSKLTFTLTQEQTLACKAGKALVQLRIIDGDAALASTMAEVEIFDIVKDGEIKDEY
jgi:hypothetical protein